MNRILAGIDKVSIWTGKLFSICFLFASIIVSYAAVMRYLFSMPSVWGLELTAYLCGATYMMSGAYAELFGAHIRIDPLYEWFPERTKLLVDIVLTGPLLFIFCVPVIWSSAQWTWEAMITSEGSGSAWNPIIWPIRILVPIGTFALLLQGVANYFRNFQKLSKVS